MQTTDLPPFDPFAPGEFQSGLSAATTKFVGVDLNSLAVETLLEVNGTVSEAVSDGRWLAWTSGLENTLNVRDLQDGAQSRLLEDQAETTRFTLIALDTGRLVVTWRIALDSLQSMVTVIDLASGEQTTIGPVKIGYAPSAVAISGDRLALRVQQPGAQEPFTPRTDDMIDHIDLRTGERSTLVSNPGIEYGSLFISDDRLIWTEIDLSTNRFEVHSYDLHSGRIESLATFGQDVGLGFNEIDDIGQAGFLIHRLDLPGGLFLPFPFALPISSNEAYVFHLFDGSTRTIFENELRFPPETPPIPVEPVVLADFIVLRDSVSAEYIVHNIESNEQRRFDPFAQ
ncbi:MAG: hypothetical protein O7D94_07925 [Planctomycetota bacterium]|nr:hypothetical protein [Planctomycetota bacterium]